MRKLSLASIQFPFYQLTSSCSPWSCKVRLTEQFNCSFPCVDSLFLPFITVKSRNNESRNNELSRYKEVGGDDAVMQVSIEKSRYNELSRNNEVKGADGAPSLLRDFTVLFLHCVNINWGKKLESPFFVCDVI